MVRAHLTPYLNHSEMSGFFVFGLGLCCIFLIRLKYEEKCVRIAMYEDLETKYEKEITEYFNTA